MPPHLPKLASAYGSLRKRIALARFGAQFGTEFALLRCDVALAGNQKLRFQFRWHSGSVDSPWAVFVHLLDRHGEVRLQADHPLHRYNQDPWGFISYSLEVPAPAPDAENSYSVRMGIWNPKTAERLPVVYSKGLAVHSAESAVLFGDIRVQ